MSGKYTKNPSGAEPTHQLKVTDKQAGTVATVGVAWVNDKGYFSIKLNAHVVLSEVQLRDCYLSLYPSKYDVPTEKVMRQMGQEAESV